MRRWTRLIIISGDDDWVQTMQENSWLPPGCAGKELAWNKKFISVNLGNESFEDEEEE